MDFVVLRKKEKENINNNTLEKEQITESNSSKREKIV